MIVQTKDLGNFVIVDILFMQKTGGDDMNPKDKKPISDGRKGDVPRFNIVVVLLVGLQP